MDENAQTRMSHTSPFISSDSPQISVILACYNEVENLQPMLDELNAVLDPLAKSYEVIYVDDGSTDGTGAKMKQLATEHPRVRALFHSRNFGQSAALCSAFAVARGDYVVVLDSDLQNDPADIPRMLALLESEKADAVCGIRKKRMDKWTKRVSSRIANRVRDWVLKDGIHDAGCAYRVIRREALQQLPAFKALHRFLPSILQWHGYKVVETPVNHRPRTLGVSKYGVGNRAFVGIADLVGMSWYRARHFRPNRLANVPPQ